jgi:hypothetical protein
MCAAIPFGGHEHVRLAAHHLRHRAVAVQVELERHILKPGFHLQVQRKKSGRLSSATVWVMGSQRAPPRHSDGFVEGKHGMLRETHGFRQELVNKNHVLGVMAHVEFERHILKPGLMFKGKG